MVPKTFMIRPLITKALKQLVPHLLHSSPVHSQIPLSVHSCLISHTLRESRALSPEPLELDSNPHRGTEMAEICSGAACAPHIQ